MNVLRERIPVELSIVDVVADVDRAQIADVIRKERLLSARIGRLVGADVGNWIVAIGFVDEEASRLTSSPRAIDHLFPDFAGVHVAGHVASGRIDQVVARSRLDCVHELRRHRDGDVEVGNLRQVFLAVDERHYVWMIDAQNAHVGAAPRSTLLDGIGRRIVQLHERHRARRNAGRRAHHRPRTTQPREAETGAATRLMNQRHRPQGVVNAVVPVR